MDKPNHIEFHINAPKCTVICKQRTADELDYLAEESFFVCD